MPVLPNATLDGATGSGSFVSQLGSTLNSAALGAVGLSSRSNSRNVADMFQYTRRTTGPTAFSFPDAQLDWRVRISLAPNSDYFYNDPSNTLLRPLTTESSTLMNSIASGISNLGSRFGGPTPASKRIGVIFTYTPALAVTHTANYTPQKLTHNNYTQHYYDNSEVQAITINAEFTVQNINEGQYLLACIYFFRSVTKMFFGKDPDAGNPPPIVYLNGYGQYYLPNVPCVVTSFSHTMPPDCDYMDVPEPAVTNTNTSLLNYRANSTRLPTSSTMSLTLQPVYSRLMQSQGFSLRDFSKGALINTASAQGRFGVTQAPTYTINNRNGGML